MSPRGARGTPAWLAGVAALLAATLLPVACATSPDLESATVSATPERGVVVCGEVRAAAAGQAILAAGGNAADAAVATALMLAVTFPEAGNLGGGGFALWVPHVEDPEDDDPAARAFAVDFRETAPASLSADLFLDENGELSKELANRSALAVGVPGSVAGLHLLHRRAGVLPWRRVVAPAIAAAREGRMTRNLRHQLDRETMRARIEAGGGGAQFFPGGAAPDIGALFPQEALARTLERIAEDGPAGFYRGETARVLADALKALGGVMTVDDLAGYEPREREPLRGWFRGKEILTMPPPSSGGIVLLQALSILDGFPLDQERERMLAANAEREPTSTAAGLERSAGVSGRAVHWWVEALRRSFADRARHLGDPDFVDVPVDELLSPDWIAARRISIGERADAGVQPMGGGEPGEPARAEGNDTTHLSVLDAQGNAVSLTTTLNSSFGTGIFLPELGFFLNDELDDFAILAGAPNQFGLVGGAANSLQPGKRPLSSMTPVVVRDGGNAVTMAVGARGGPRIITAVFLAILRTEVYGQSLAEALRAPRLHQQWSPVRTYLEPGWDPLIVQELKNRGHEVEISTTRTAGLNGFEVPIGGLPIGVPDPRNPLGAAARQGENAWTARVLHLADPRWAEATRGMGRAVNWEALEAAAQDAPPTE